MNPENLKRFLKDVPLLTNLEEEELAQLSSVAVVRDYDKGQIIFYEADFGTSFYIIVTGAVKVVILSKDGREHILGILKDKDFFGEISLLDGEARSTTVISMEKVTAITISREDFIRMLKNNPDITYKIILSLCERLRWTDRHTSNLAFLSAPGRVARTITELAADGVHENGKLVIPHKMTRQEFANLSGTSRETLTRTLMEFKEEGLIDMERNQIIVLDMLKLEDKII